MVRKFDNIQQASEAAVKLFIDIARAAVQDNGFCTIVLAGGTTPKQMFKLLSAPGTAAQLPLEQSHFFWGDERWVAPTHPDSNFAMAHKALLSKVHIPPLNIHRINTDLQNPEVGARMYEKHLRDFFDSTFLTDVNSSMAEMTLPLFDLVILGMGADGHTASLFPGSNILEEKKKWVAAVPEGIGLPPVARITLTLPVINQAKNILFLISGSQKRKILDTILTKPEKAVTLYPAARIKPIGNLVWIVADKS